MSKDAEMTTEEASTTRRSSRIASQAKPPSAAAPPKERKPRGKKRTTDDSNGEEASGEPAADGAESPVSKKAKPASKAAAKPASKAAKPASKAEKEKPESKAEKPESKAKPSSKAKPASKGKPSSKAKPASKAKGEGEASEAPAAGATDTIMEEPEETNAEDADKPAETETKTAEAPVESAAEPAEAAKEPEAKEEAEAAKETETSKDEGAAKDAEPAKAAEAAAEAPAEASTSTKALEIGEVLPSITLPNQSGENVELGSLAKEKGVVIFVVPKANTPGCTTQACGFRDNYQDFTGLDYAVYCLSHDSPKVQTSWQTKHTLPYPLLSDPKRTFIGLLGAGAGNTTKRSHFVFEKGTGKLVEKQIGVKPADSPKSALEFVKKHAASA